MREAHPRKLDALDAATAPRVALLVVHHEAARERGCHFIDAPVSGGQAGAEQGILTIMCGGDPEAFQRAEPVIAAYARAVTRIGESGAGQLAKMVNQISVAGLLQALSEAIAFGEHAGLDMRVVLDVISKGAASSWQMENRGPTMLQSKFDFGFAVDWMRKDLGLCLDEARRNGAGMDLLSQFASRAETRCAQHGHRLPMAANVCLRRVGNGLRCLPGHEPLVWPASPHAQHNHAGVRDAGGAEARAMCLSDSSVPPRPSDKRQLS